MNILIKLYQIFLSEYAKQRIEKTILYVALFGFFIHLILIYLSKFGIVNLSLESKLFKDLSALELSSDWFEIKGDLQFTYDILASVILFHLIFQFQKQGMQKSTQQKDNKLKIERFIRRKKITAVVLVPIFFTMALVTLFNWTSDISFTSNKLPSFETVNNLFFDEFFTVLILVDVVLLLISFFYTDKFHKIIRNSGFVVSTILIRMSFGVSGLISTILIVVAILFGLAIIIIHNKYEKNTLPNNV